MLQIGDKAPLTVTVQDTAGASVSLEHFRGTYIVLYFYPKDDTPGCTTEACSFRDHLPTLNARGVTVIGVSKDSHISHQKFGKKYELPFPLWSDPDHVLMEAFGVWGKRSFMGKSYMGTSRSTFLIGPDGTILHVWEKVAPKGHAEDVIRVVSDIIDSQQT